MSKSEEKKPKLPVTEMFEELGSGAELTTVEVLKSMIDSDKHLSMITQHKNTSALAVLGVLIAYANTKEYQPVVNVLEVLEKKILEYQCSFGGWRANQMFQGIIADFERLKRETEDLKERLVGRGKR